MTALRRVTPIDEPWNVHLARAVLYRTTARLLDPTADLDFLPALRTELGGVHCPAPFLAAHDELSTTFKGVDAPTALAAKQRWAQAHGPIDQNCSRGYGSAWPRACVVTQVQATINPITELHVLARLATLTADAIREGNESLAREYRSLQRQLLSQHSGLCLETLGAHLAADGGPVLSGIGRALERLIEADVKDVSAW
jgi:hypothetical protein